MTDKQRARMEYLREDLAVWEARRRRARWNLALDRLYNCSAMDEVLGEFLSELKRLEALDKKESKESPNRRRPNSRLGQALS